MPTRTGCTSRLFGAFAISILIGLMSGCAHTAEEMAEEAAPSAATETIAQLNEPENREHLNELMSLPGIATSGELLSRGMVRGLMAAMGEEIDPEQIAALARSLTDGLNAALVRTVNGELVPAIEDAVGGMVDAALDEALSPQTRRQASTFADELTRTITRAALQVFAEQLRQELGPAIRELIAEEVGAGIATAVRRHAGPATVEVMQDDELRRALADNAHAVGKHTVLGANEGLRQLREDAPEGQATPLEAAQGIVSQGEDTLQTVMWMLGVAVLVLLLLVVALGLGLWRTMARGHELIEESKVREESLSDMAHAVEEAEKSD